MEAVKKFVEQERNTLELVLKEMLNEQQNANKISVDQVAAINELINNVNGFNERLANLKIIAPPVSTKGFVDMQFTACNQPKNVTRKFQILLFPEQDAKLFYKIVFGRWFLWLVIMLFVTNLYKWSIHWSDNQKEIKLEQLEIDRVKKAWNYLYFQQSKSIKRLMDSAYYKIKEQQ